MTASPNPQDPGFSKYGNYVLLDRINVGGMAEVFRGRKLGPEGFAKMVALKRILPNIAEDEEFIEMFVDEAKLTASLQHANVVQIYDLGQAEGTYYIAMEYVSGVDLRTVWDRARKRNRLLPIAMSCFIMQRVCEGLDYAHRKKDDFNRDMGLVHRDVSPQNVLVSFEGEVKVVDFGIAKAKNKISKTQQGILKGKFGYMSPEQVRGSELDNRSDIFACGVVLWEMLVGDRLFLGESDFSTLEKVRNVDLVAPTQLNKNLSPQVERIVMKALAKNREDRYRWCSDMAEDLQRYLFESNQPFQRADLQRYMKQHFAKEIDEEYARVDRYRNIKESDVAGPAVVATPAAAAAAAGAGMVAHEGATQVGQLAPGQATALQARPVQLGAISSSNQAATALLPGVPGITSGVPSNGGTYAGQQPIFQTGQSQIAQPPPHGLPGWAKATIGVLSVLAVGGVGLVAAHQMGVFKPEPASLTVDVTPADAEIVVNEELVSSKSPFTVDNLPPGTHVLVVRKAGYKRVVKPFKVTEGEVKMESITLEKAEGTASLFVRTTPKGLAVWLDGRDTGKLTPATLTTLHAGDHEIVLLRDGDVVYKSPVKLADNDAVPIEVDLDKLPAVLEVTSNRPDAKVSVNGKALGGVPLKTDTLPPGKVKVKVDADSCTSFVSELELKRASTSKVEAALTCKGPPPAAVETFGQLNVTATMMADVFIDGQRVGQTPAMGLRVAAGKRELKLVPLAGDKQPATQQITIETGKLTSIEHKF